MVSVEYLLTASKAVWFRQGPLRYISMLGAYSDGFVSIDVESFMQATSVVLS